MEYLCIQNNDKILMIVMRQNIMLSMLTALFLCSCGSNDKQAESIPSVRVVEARVSGEGSTQQYPGRVVAAADANVSFKVAGTLRRVNVKEGQRVNKGQLLAELDNTDYLVQLKATEAEHAQIKADAERVIGLYGEGGTTSSNYDKARYGLEQINAKLEHHRNQLSYTRIYAPYDGYVQRVFMSEGETVGAGMPVVGMLSSDAPEIELNLPASAYANRRNFRSFTCSFDVLPGEMVTATPVSVLPQANSNQLYTMRLKLAERVEDVSPGMSTWIIITTSDDTTPSVCVPTTSLLQKDGESYLFVYSAQSQTVKKVLVHVNQLHTDGTAEVQGSVKEGDFVVSSGVHHVRDGAKVKRMAEVSKTNVGGLM